MTNCLLQASWTPPPPPSNTLGKGKLLGKASLYIFVWCLAVSISGTPLSAAQHSITVFWTGACGQWMPLANISIHNLPAQKISSIRYQRSSKHIIEHHMAESWPKRIISSTFVNSWHSQLCLQDLEQTELQQGVHLDGSARAMWKKQQLWDKQKKSLHKNMEKLWKVEACWNVCPQLHWIESDCNSAQCFGQMLGRLWDNNPPHQSSRARCNCSEESRSVNDVYILCLRMVTDTAQHLGWW